MTKSSMISCACSSVSVLLGQVSLEVDVQECGDAADRHGGAVLFLHRGKVGEVQPLHGLAGRAGGPGEIEAIALGHYQELVQRSDLFAEFLTITDDVLRVDIEESEGGFLSFFLLDEPCHAIEGHAPVVADDPAATIGIGEAGEDV